MKKRLLSLVLSVCMLAAMIPAAFAVQVSTPTGLEWCDTPSTIEHVTTTFPNQPSSEEIFPWDIVWNRVENGSNRYNIIIYKDGTLIDEADWSFDATDISEQLAVDLFRQLPRESGTYKFTIQALGDGNEYTDSAIATSVEKAYTAPSEQLATPTNLRWDGATARWDEVASAGSYGIDWYFSETAEGPFEPAGSTWGWNLDDEDSNSIELEDWVVVNHGAGYYAFKIRALSNDVDVIRPSEISALSPIYSTDGATTTVSDSLDQIITTLDTADIATAVEAVKALDSEELRIAMEADRSENGVTSKIETIEDETGIKLSTEVDDGIDMDTSKISMTGAKLNAGKDITEMTFNISKPEEAAVVPGAYANAVQFDFQLNGAAPESSGDFAVPIKITMPIPEDIVPDKLRILHYGADGIDEILFPYVFREGDDWYASFVVTHFSTFVFAEATTAATIGDKEYDTLQEAIDAAQSGDNISLYRDHPDTETVLVENKSLDISCGVYTLNPDVVTVGAGCTKNVEGTNGTDQVIHVTYRSTSGGSSSGGGSSTPSNLVSVGQNNNGTISVSPSRAQTGDTVTVTIDPDEGYVLDELIVTDRNGNRVSVTRVSDTEYTFTKPIGVVKVEATFTEDTGEEQPSTSSIPFTDVATTAWYYDAVEYMYENGMMNGTSDTTFSPNATTTRAMIVTMLHRLEGEPDASDVNFTDIASGMYYADAVAWAQENGVVTGTSETTFSPDQAITREQLATILYRYAQVKGYDVTASTDLAAYTDAAQISAFALTAMQWANAEGLITGNTATTINPTGDATRAEVATILMRFAENVAQA